MSAHIHQWLLWMRFNFSYLMSPPWDTGISPPELVEFIQSHPPGRALDLGCGSGTNLLQLALAGWQVTGIDFAWIGVALARRRLARAGVQGAVFLGDVTRLQALSGRFDLALDIGCYHSLASEKKINYEENLQNLLAAGGCFLIYAHFSDGSKTGITEADILRLSQFLDLKKRVECTDRARRAVWLLFSSNAQG